MAIVAKRSPISATAELLFQYGGLPPSGFILRVIGPPTKSIWYLWFLQNLVGIGAVVSIKCSFRFRPFGLKMSIRAPKIGILGM